MNASGLLDWARSARAAWAHGLWRPSGGARLLRSGRFAEARNAFAARVAEHPRDRVAVAGLGYVALLHNDLAEAEQRLGAAVRATPRNKEVLALLAEVHYRRDDFARAAPLLRRAGREAAARKLESFESRRPYRVSGTLPTEVAFTRTDPLPFVRVHVNATHEGLFLIDTGGGELILDVEFARRVQARGFGSAHEGYFGGGKEAAIAHARLDAVRLGGVEVEDVPVQVIRLAAIGPVLGEERIDGVIGTVFLHHFRSTLDYQAGRLVLERRGESRATGRQEDVAPLVAIPFWLADDHLMVAWGSANGAAPMLFLVDTGLGGVGFTCPRSTLRAAQIDVRSSEATQSLGGGGAFTATPFTLDELRLGGVTRTQMGGVAGAFPPQLEWDLGFRVGGLVSHEFFRSGALTLDVANMRLLVRP